MKKLYTSLAFLAFFLALLIPRSDAVVFAAESKFNLTSAAASVSGWTNVSGDPRTGVRTATDSATGIGLRSITTYWNNANGTNAWNGLGASSDDGGGFAFPASVVLNYWYNTASFFTSGQYHVQLFGLDPDMTYTLEMMGSRGTGSGATSPRVTDYNVRGETALTVQSLDTWLNTSETITFANVVPNSSGQIDIAVNRRANGTGGNFGYLNGVIVTEDNPAVPPSADAGSNQTIESPTTETTLDGSDSTDSDGTIASYAWSFVSGPSTPTIVSASSAITAVTGLSSSGTYVFRLTVTDNTGNTDTDDVNVVFQPEVLESKFNLSSAAASVSGWTNVAGDPQTGIRSAVDPVSGFGLRSITTYWDTGNGSNAWNGLGASVDDGGGFAFPSGVVANYWYNVNDIFTSGQYHAQLYGLDDEKTYTIVMLGSRSNSGASSPRVTDYNLRGVSALSAQSLDSFQNTSETVTFFNVAPNASGVIDIAVNKKADGTGGNFGYLNGLTITEDTGNVAPSADAGSNQSITLPTTTATLSGSGSDTDGTIASYAWSFISGPSTPSITSASSASTGLTALSSAGTYVFRLTVTDNEGSTSTDDVNVVVNQAANAAPVADAGPDNSVQLPVTSVVLDGTDSTDSDGSISTYAWTEVTSKGATIVSASSSSTVIEDLVDGTHTFRLTVTDNEGETDTDDVTITVDEHNTSSCAVKHIVLLGSSTTAGLGLNPISGSWANRFGTYLEGIDGGYTVTNLAISGYTTYHILATGSTPPGGRPSPDTDNNITYGLTFNPDAIIINMPSNDTAAGYSVAEQQTNYQTLVSIADNANVPVWIATAQPRNLDATGRANQATMKNWILSTYEDHAIDFWTTLANTDGTINTTYSQGDGIHLNALGHTKLYSRVLGSNIMEELCENQAPVANAGIDQTIHLPTTTATLSGSATDGDGTIASYAWTFVSGPSTPSITSASTASTGITALSSAGTYVFRLTATDNSGATDTDDISIVMNTAPTANAGADQIVHLPTTSTTLSGSGTDTDGTISTYAWSFISGPATPSITSSSSVSTGVTGLSSAGTYVFRLTVTDNRGATNTDNISVVSNTLPVANAGTDKIITYPTSTTSLSGSATDSNGTIASYAWSFVSGPATASFSAGSSASTNTTGLSSAGIYVLRLTVTDNHGGTDTDDITVTVNVAPVADAGTDQSITLPTTTVSLSGSASDVDGTIVSYLWEPVSGPSTPTITSSNAASTGITALESAGTYVFRLTATDDDGATDTDDVTIIVNTPQNQSPTADAGSDQAITLPTSTATLSGSGTDTDGTIDTYAWSFVSGPSTPSITSSSSASTGITALSSAGTYVFRLTVTDDDDTTGTDDVSVVVSAAPTSSGGGGGGGRRSSSRNDDDEPVVPVVTVPVATPLPTSTDTFVRTIASLLNVRSSPNGTIIRKLPLGSVATLSSTDVQSDGGWIYVTLSDGTKGWISAQYTVPSTTSVSPVTPTTPSASNTARVATQTLNVRSGPAGAVVRQTSLGTSVSILGTSGEWTQVSFSDESTGWVSSQYLSSSIGGSTPTTPSTPSAPTGPTAPVAKAIPNGTSVSVSIPTLNVRSTPGGALTTKVSAGKVGTVVETSGNWSRVLFTDGVAGWVSTAYIRSSTGSVQIPATATPSKTAKTVRIIATSAAVYDAPNGNTIGAISKDTTGTLLSQSGGWVIVEFSYGLTGYVDITKVGFE
jgi:uncharacterized protein YgiM (DUF1202 family)/lysophospholipase L1-like esterase